MDGGGRTVAVELPGSGVEWPFEKTKLIIYNNVKATSMSISYSDSFPITSSYRLWQRERETALGAGVGVSEPGTSVINLISILYLEICQRRGYIKRSGCRRWWWSWWMRMNYVQVMAVLVSPLFTLYVIYGLVSYYAMFQVNKSTFHRMPSS